MCLSKDINEFTKSPPADYTDKLWQQDFLELKNRIHSSPLSELPSIPDDGYTPKTQYQYYADFINDILNSIRAGKVDYCFYIYQVAELLKYEHDMQAVWLPEDRFFELKLSK